MNWDYISGFFDADGSVGYYRQYKDGNKVASLSFHNNEKVIINKIHQFIKSELGYSGSISTKKSKEELHSDGFNLTYSYSAAIKIANKITTIHPKKRHRINILSKIQKLIPRNGKYTQEVKDKIAELELLYK